MNLIAIGITVLIILAIAGLIFLLLWLLEKTNGLAGVVIAIVCLAIGGGFVIYRDYIYPWVMTWDIGW
jgi:hypothetical protein